MYLRPISIQLKFLWKLISVVDREVVPVEPPLDSMAVAEDVVAVRHQGLWMMTVAVAVRHQGHGME